ncbi:putative E3 ubiquitin-protein ligase RNF216 [Blattamonas nauphoetae]|uniref:E3 ubiquitin-protein ligase RNF216 n=1 Tax=Blattamonas nauphoetae TaxID=2049346 RepID=A0ABQ9XCX4_9EUKA|nr:putative E3 ubiquitin-protein ligase RNF216 [Blattamonas nauphoetae]
MSQSNILSEEIGNPQKIDIDMVSSIFPEIDTLYLLNLIQTLPKDQNPNDALFQILLQQDGSYPKVKRPGSDRAPEPVPQIFADVTGRYSRAYCKETMEYVSSQYRHIPVDWLIVQVQAHNFNLPAILKDLDDNLVFHPNEILYCGERIRSLPFERTVIDPLPTDPDFIVDLNSCKDEHTTKLTRLIKHSEYEAAGGAFFDCPICYESYPMEQVLQCSEGCLICRACLRDHLITGLNSQKLNFSCVTDTECPGVYVESIVNQVLDPDEQRRMTNLDFDRTVKESIENKVECPFCDYFEIIEADIAAHPEFHCKNPRCSKVSCRKCGKEAHYPALCAEDESAHDNFRKVVESAMTNARIRSCHRCRKPLIKIDGCNRITCTCGAFMCYACGQALDDKNPYQHFKQNDANLDAQMKRNLINGTQGFCLLYEDSTEQDNRRVEIAKKQAIKKWKQENPAFAHLEFDVKVKEFNPRAGQDTVIEHQQYVRPPNPRRQRAGRGRQRR